MADPSSEDEGLLREWAPLTSLLQQIPLKAQRGIFTHELNLTCVDALSDFIALGTNLGLVYWYNRRKGELQRLRCENTACAVTCVRVISTVDYMVAAGNEQGIVSVFQIPKDPPDCLPESMKPRRKKQVERYTITGLHTSPVTAIEWSLNGMKLFSGDKNGLVVLTEIDFYMHLSKSVELLNEKYEIVQLSYCQQLLLVSTTYRSIVCHKDDRWRVTQVGQKERKSLGKLGATFCVGSERPQDLFLYASRPGLRLWLADKNGIVQQTLIYKDTMMREHRHVPLVNPVPAHMKNSKIEHTFGPLHVFKENLLVTYNQDTVYVLNPTDIFVVATVSDLRKVQDVSVTKDEIFILEGDRSIIRVAYLPENILEQQDKNMPPVPCNPDTMNEIFLHIVGDPEIQEKLSDPTSDHNSVWNYIASEMSQLGYPFGDEYGAKKCQEKWNCMVNSYNSFQETKLTSSDLEYPLYFETLDHILNPLLKIGGEQAVISVTSVSAGEGSPSEEPQIKRLKQEQDLYDTESVLSTMSQGCERSEFVEMSEVTDDANSVYVDMVNEAESVFYDDEHVTILPVSSSTELADEVVIPTAGIEDNQNIYILVTPSFDDLPDFENDSEDDEKEGTEHPNEVVSFAYESGEHFIEQNTELEDETFTITKELVVSSKSNQSLRPVPTPPQALMALVTRIGREEKQRDNLRRYNIEKRFEGLENAIWKQSVDIMELTGRATALLSNLLQEDSSDSD